ncbi:MAG TPA: nucleoside 2-deoxyribosyltransferase, partial [Pyrinomonadaceae bacterium]|jgi:nucleoside 2-deoxyribosyltransferase|nr:nucleoside 2-deoxyribosyltransferase [Pyrinomonadaceae bacterium]
MKIYFAGSIRGGRSDAALYYEIVKQLRNHGEVLTEHVGDTELGILGQHIGDRKIHDRDLEWLRDSDCLVAEVTNPSLGVGYEVGKAAEWGKPVLCLYRPANGRSLSAMIAGCRAVTVREYQNPAELPAIFKEFLRS